MMMLSSSLPAQDDFEEQPQRGEDYELLSGWARSLSVSPRLYPTYGAPSLSSLSDRDHGGGVPSSYSSYRGLGDGSPMLGAVRHNDSLSLTAVMSPLLGPSHPSSSGLGGPSSGTAGGDGSTLMPSGGYDYSTFGQYHTSPPVGSSRHAVHSTPHLTHKSHSNAQSQSHVHSSGMARRTSRNGSNHSFSNVDGVRSLSPPEPSLSNRSRSPTEVKLEGGEKQDIPMREPSPPPAEAEDPRIRAYAKLEFPTFDIYIQKLSVVIGRRPAAVASAVSISNGAAGANGNSPSALATELASAFSGAQQSPALSEVKLEDFVVGMSEGEVEKEEIKKEDVKVKAVKQEPPLDAIGVPKSGDPLVTRIKEEEVTVPLLSVTPTSRPPSPSSTPSSAKPAVLPTSNSSVLQPATPVHTLSLPATAMVLPTAPGAKNDVVDTQPRPQSASMPTDPVPSPTIPPTEKETAALLELLTKANASDAPLHLSPATDTSALPATPATLTDIDLGPIRAVSRQHARLYFDYEMGGWAIEVLGRNGVVVEGKWTAKGEREPLGKRTKIQIAERIFYFVLPSVDTQPDPTTAPTGTSEHAMDGEGFDASDSERSHRDDDDGDDSSSLSEVSSISGDEEDDAARPSIPPIRIKVPTKPSNSPQASTSRLPDLALAPPVRAAAKGAVYKRQGQGGKRPEVLQAARAAGKGKGKGKNVVSKGKGKGGKKGKGVRRMSDVSLASESVLSGDEDGGEAMRELDDVDEMDVDEGTGRSRTTSLGSTSKPADEIRRIVIKQNHQVPTKKPKQNLKPLASPASTLSTVPSPSLASAALPPLPSSISASAAQPPAPPKASVPPTAGPSATSAIVSAPGPAVSTPSARPVVPNSSLTPSGLIVPPGTVPGAAHALVPGALPGQPGGPPVKRGRGRPPKNGICAQRPRKPKPDAAVQAAAAAAAARKAASLSAAPPTPGNPQASSSIDPALTSPAVAGASKTVVPAAHYTPAPPPANGEKMPLAAPADDLLTKPPYTYASLIAQACHSSENRKLTLNGIYDWITSRWPYFSDNQNGWQNSIRHNLTLSRGFLKVPRRDDEAGKGAFWMIDPAQVENFDGLNFRKKVIKPPVPPPTPTPAPVAPPRPAMAAAPVPPRPVAVPPRPAAATPAAPPKPGQRPPAPSLSAPLPIIVSPIPESYVRPAPPPASAPPPDELTAALLKDPPIVLHEGKLILNPAIFANLTKDQLDNLQVLPASQALQILQAYVVQHFKEKMGKAAKEKARLLAANKKAAAERAAAAAAASGSHPTNGVPVNRPNVPGGTQPPARPVGIGSASPVPPPVARPGIPQPPSVPRPNGPAGPSMPPTAAPPKPVSQPPVGVRPPPAPSDDDDVVIVESRPATAPTLKRKLDGNSPAPAPAPKIAKVESLGGSVGK